MGYTARLESWREGGARLFRRFRRDTDGATVIEFGLIAVPFIALLFAIIETGLIFFADQTLETAVANTARLIRTGQAQQQGLTGSTFATTLCAQTQPLFDCSKLKVDGRTSQTFDSVDLSKPVDTNGNLKTDFGYLPGHGGDIVVVRAFYEWPVFAKLLGLNYSNLADGSHLIAATAAFRNEPFPW